MAQQKAAGPGDQEGEPWKQGLLMYLGREEMFQNMDMLDRSGNTLQFSNSQRSSGSTPLDSQLESLLIYQELL